MKFLRVAAVTVGLIAFSTATVSPASAATVTVDSISANWTNVVGGGSSVSNTVNGAGTAELRWGENAGFGQSGYDFDPSAPPAFDVNSGEAFVIGNFTHINMPIRSGTSIDSAQLDVLVEIASGGEPGPYLFSFLHDETPNRCSPRPNCANDIVKISNLVTSDTFSIGDQLFTLSVLGFSTDGGVTISDMFSSREKHTNSAKLYAEFVSVVPLPAALPLFLSMLAGMGFLRWWRKKTVSAAT